MPRPPSEAPLLGIEDLAGRRGDRLLFSGLSAVAAAGEALRLSGPNGCGKTTALRIVCGLLRPETGRVRWRGRIVSEHRGDPAWRRELAFIGHHEALKDNLTPLENLRFARALRGGRAPCSPEEAIERVGLAAERDTLSRELSAGQRRRAALARLLLDDAVLWVLDEPSSALDRDGTSLVESLCSEHASAGGVLLFTSHLPLALASGRVREFRLASG